MFIFLIILVLFCVLYSRKVYANEYILICRLSNVLVESEPFFMFGDFNFRLDFPAVIKVFTIPYLLSWVLSNISVWVGISLTIN